MRNYTNAERQEHLEKWKNSALSKAAYAKSVGIYPTTFYTWIRGKPGRKVQDFIEISTQVMQKTSHDLVIEKGNLIIRIPLSVGAKELHTVFTVLEDTK